MSSRWVEGIDYSIEKTPEGQEVIKCLHCGRQLSGKPAIGPHLSRCVKPSVEAPPSKPSEAEEWMDEKQNLIELLEKFHVRYSQAIASFLEPFGFEDLDTLDEALRLSQVDLGKRKLIVTRWAYHVQRPITPTLMQRWSQPAIGPIEMQPPAFQTQQPPLTREDLHQILEERERAKAKEEEVKQLREEIEMLKRELSEGNPKKKSEIEQLREEIRKMREDEISARLNKLEGYVMGGISNPYAFLGLVAKETADIIKGSPLRHYILTGQLPSPPKEVEPQAREASSKIFSKINPRYVTEE